MTVAETASSMLPDLAREFFETGRRAFLEDDAEGLHQFRIAGKRFRYTLEIFADVYGPALERKLKALKTLQDALGDLNDVATARTLLESEAALQFLDRRESEVRGSLKKVWKAKFSRAKTEHDWCAFLSRFATSR